MQMIWNMLAFEVLNEFQWFVTQKRMVLSFIISQIGLFRSVFKSKQETRLTNDIFLAFHQKPKKKERFLELSGNSDSE